MPSKIRKDDWDRYFSPKGPRHGGPLQVLISTVLVIGTIVGLGFGAYKAKGILDERQAMFSATATVVAATVGPGQTATAIAIGQTATAKLAPSPTPSAPLLTGQVLNGGNLRSEPRVAPETLIGTIGVGSEFVFLEEQTIEDQLWYRIRMVSLAGASSVEADAEGWASSTLLSEPVAAIVPEPTAAPEPTGTPAPTPTPTGPLGVLVTTTKLEAGMSILIPQGWTEVVTGTTQGEFIWAPAQPVPPQDGGIVGQVTRRAGEERQPSLIAIASDSCIFNMATRLGQGTPIISKESQGADGTLTGTFTTPRLKGRFRTYLGRENLVCLYLALPTDQYSSAESDVRKILDSVSIQ